MYFRIENVCILIQISLKFVRRGCIDSKSVLVVVMAWCLISHKLLPEMTIKQFTDAYLPPGLNELTLWGSNKHGGLWQTTNTIKIFVKENICIWSKSIIWYMIGN